MSVKVTKKGPGAAGLLLSLQQIEHADVLVGIPASTTLRVGEPINNASLLFLHSKGSPLRNLPARPVLEPSIEANKKIIAPHLAAAAKAVLDHDPEKAELELQRAGVVAANGAKRWFSKEHLAPNAPSTIRRKGSNTPLVDEGFLRKSVTSVVRIKP